MTHRLPPSWAPAGASSPLDDKLGIRIIDYDPDRLVATMPVEGNEQPFGLLHGGRHLRADGDDRLVGGERSARARSGRAVGIELNASYLRGRRRPASSPPSARRCAAGRTLPTFLIEVTDDQGRPTASGRLTCMILPA